MIAALFSPYRGRNDLRIDDLVHFAADVVPQVAGPQLRYKVTSIPDARTVRYYIQEGLVDSPHGASGPAALYGYRHLLQLVLVKVLQAHYLPIRQIRQTIEKLTDRELEKLLESWRSKTPSSPPSDSLTASSSRVSPPLALRDSPRQEVESVPAAPDPSAQAFLRSIARSERPPTPSQISAGSASEGAQPGRAIDFDAGWVRHELYPGVELHVHDGAVIPSGTSFSSALASRLRVIMERVVLEKVALHKRSKP